MTRTVEDLRSVDHACAVPVSDEHLWEITAGFIAAGLARGEQVVYFDDDGAADAVLDRLADDRVPVDDALAAGSFSVVPAEATREAVRKSVLQVEQLVRGTVDSAVELGYSGLRMTGQFSYALQRPGGVSLHEYCAGLDRVVRERPLRLLCLYDRGRFPDSAIDELRAQHHTEIGAAPGYDDNLLRITSTAPGAARLAGEVDHSNRPQIRRLLDLLLDQALRSHSAPVDITLDLSSLRFLDVAGAVGLVHAAEEFPSTHRLVLSGVRPRVVRVLDRCGAPFAAQLVVDARSEPAPGAR